MSKKWIISVLALLSVSQLSADPLFLSLPIDAVNQSQANSGVASVRGPSAIRYNPAGLGFANGHEARTTYQLLGDFLSANSVQATYSFAPYFSVGFFFSALYLNEGFTQVENFQETSNSLGMFSADVGVSAGYQVLKNLAFGGNLRYFRLQLGPQVAQSIGVDLGTQYKFNIPGISKGYEKFSVGLTARNIGPAFDFYGGGQKENQPLMIQTGLSYEPFPFLVASMDYRYSIIESSSFHTGFVLFPDAYISPRAGVQFDFTGISYTMGGGFSYGTENKFQAFTGLSLGNQLTGGDVFFSLNFQRPMFDTSKTTSSYTSPKVTEPEKIALNYEPIRIIPFTSAYRSEKIQGVLISQEKALGTLQNEMVLKRVAVQPEDEKHLRYMTENAIEELELTNRRMGLWLNLQDTPERQKMVWWDSFSGIVQKDGLIQILYGKNLDSLNSNPNAPLKVEWRLDVKLVEGKDQREIRTTLYELYSGSLVLARNFTFSTDNNLNYNWEEVAAFYADYMTKIRSFYILRVAK